MDIKLIKVQATAVQAAFSPVVAEEVLAANVSADWRRQRRSYTYNVLLKFSATSSSLLAGNLYSYTVKSPMAPLFGAYVLTIIETRRKHRQDPVYHVLQGYTETENTSNYIYSTQIQYSLFDLFHTFQYLQSLLLFYDQEDRQCSHRISLTIQLSSSCLPRQLSNSPSQLSEETNTCLLPSDTSTLTHATFIIKFHCKNTIIFLPLCTT